MGKAVTKKKQKTQSFWHKPAGYFVSTVVLLGAAYILVSFAIDSGSILEWVGALVAVLWAIGRLIQGLKILIVSKVHDKKRKNS